MPGLFMTKKEVCELLNISEGTLRGIMERHELPYYKIGGCVRFSSEDVTAYVKRQVVRAVPTVITPAPVASVSRGRGRPLKATADIGYYPGMKVV